MAANVSDKLLNHSIFKIIAKRFKILANKSLFLEGVRNFAGPQGSMGQYIVQRLQKPLVALRAKAFLPYLF